MDSPPSRKDLLTSNRVLRWPVILLPVEPDAALLPQWNVVEVDAVSEQQLVLVRNRHAFERRRRFMDAFALLPKDPITVRIERIAVGVFVSPSEVIDDEFERWKLRDSAVKRRHCPQKQGKLCTAFTGENRDQLAELAAETVFLQ